MKHASLLRCALVASLLSVTALAAQAQLDYSAYGVLDFSYGRFEPSGTYREHRFNSNSMSASFVGVDARYGFDGGWTPGITLETFLQLQDFRTGRSRDDPFLSRNAFASLASPYGTVNVGRLQTFLFNTATRFNALGNSIAFGPSIRHLFLSGNLDGVQGDFYWDRAASYVSPNLEGVTGSVMYARGPSERRGNYSAANVVFSRGLFAAGLSGQRVQFDNGFDDATNEQTWQLGATYNFGFARVFGQYGQTRDRGVEVRSRIASTGVAFPIGPGTVLSQVALTTTDGPAVDRKHTSVSAAYIYPYSSVLDLYVAGMDDRVRGQTRGLSFATGVRFRFP